MKQQTQAVIQWAKSHTVATAVLVALFAPGFVFGFVWNVLGLIGFGRIFLALLVLGGWAAYKFVRSQVDGYKETVDSAVSLARDIRSDYL
jgi:hypothetical protein